MDAPVLLYTGEVETVYVLGFAFDHGRKRVLLVRKTHPEWQNGKLNGIGGKVEPDETPLQAMLREWDEEANFAHQLQPRGPLNWHEYHTLLVPAKKVKVHVFRAFTDEENLISREGRLTDTGEVLRALLLAYLTVRGFRHMDFTTVSNIPWLLAMALDVEHEFSISTMEAT